MEGDDLIRFIVQLVTTSLLVAMLNFCGQREKKSGAMAAKTASNQAEVKTTMDKAKGQKRDKDSKEKDEVKGDEGKEGKEKKDEAKAEEKSKETPKDVKPGNDLKEKFKEASKNEDQTQASTMTGHQKGDEQAQAMVPKLDGDAQRKSKDSAEKDDPTQVSGAPKPEVTKPQHIESKHEKPDREEASKLESKLKEVSEKGGSAIKFSHKRFEWDESGGQQTMTVTNCTETTQAIKIKSSDNKIFRVYPVYSNVKPGQSINITVLRQAAPIKMDKIVIVSAPNKDNESAEKIFTKRDLKLSISVVRQTGRKAAADTGKESKEKAAKEEKSKKG